MALYNEKMKVSEGFVKTFAQLISGDDSLYSQRCLKNAGEAWDGPSVRRKEQEQRVRVIKARYKKQEDEWREKIAQEKKEEAKKERNDEEDERTYQKEKNDVKKLMDPGQYENNILLKEQQLFCRYTQMKLVEKQEAELLTIDTNNVFELEFADLTKEFLKVQNLLGKNYFSSTQQQRRMLESITKAAGYVEVAKDVTGFLAGGLATGGKMLSSSAFNHAAASTTAKKCSSLEFALNWKARLEFFSTARSNIKKAKQYAIQFMM